MNRTAVRVSALSVVLAVLIAVTSISATGAGRRASSVAATPSTVALKAGGKLTFSGRVRPAVARPVQLQRLHGTEWRPVTRAKSASTGRFVLRVPTNLYIGKTQYRVVAPQTRSYLAATSVGKVVAITGRGRARSYTWLLGQKYRWNPCEIITYRVNPSRAPRDAAREVRQAFARFAAQGGYSFRYLGTTKAVRSRGKPGPRDADIVISWVRPGTYDLPVGPAGIGGASGSWNTVNGKTVRELRDGFVLLDARLYPQLDKGFGVGKRHGWRGTRGQLLMHEIGHVMGLGHADRDRDQIMYPSMQDLPAIWGNGDAAALRMLGLTGGCFPTEQPEPTPTPTPEPDPTAPGAAHRAPGGTVIGYLP